MKDFNLETHPKIETGFKIPADEYFDTFYDKMSNQLVRSESRTISFFKKQKIWIAAAAILIIGLSTALFWTTNPATEILFYADDDIVLDANLTTEDLAEHLTEADLVALEKQLVVHDTETMTEITQFL